MSKPDSKKQIVCRCFFGKTNSRLVQEVVFRRPDLQQSATYPAYRDVRMPFPFQGSYPNAYTAKLKIRCRISQTVFHING